MKNDIAEIRELIQAADNEHNPKKFIEKLGEFSAHAILMLPALLDELEALRKERKRYAKRFANEDDIYEEIEKLRQFKKEAMELINDIELQTIGAVAGRLKEFRRKWSTADEASN